MPQVKPELVEDLVLGCAMPEGEQGLNVARLAGLLGGGSRFLGVTEDCGQFLAAALAAHAQRSWCDDSGIEAAALDWGPGVRSARWSGAVHSATQRRHQPSKVRWISRRSPMCLPLPSGRGLRGEDRHAG